uniref:Metalloendopeptidase n=1 Tax=Daphnia galeata TaxID=27404 RepID=A0A8J2RL24_9CRUS|nr:unnamed protein product [Daphnia galeata]
MAVHSLLMVLLVSVSCILLGPVQGSPVLMPISNERAENFVAGPPITFEELRWKRPPPGGNSSQANRWQTFIPWEKQHPELVEGDIMPSRSKNAIIDSRGLWTNKIIPYVIDAAYTQDQRNIIATAMNEYHKKTCIRLVPRTTETNYIRIYKSGTGCWSYVGMLNRGMQEVSLDNGCMVNGIVIHELMHTAGFWHEHMRPDRNTYVRINLNNVLPQYKFAFDLLSTTQVTTLGLSYDYGSVMRYPKDAFAIDYSIDVITPLIGKPNIVEISKNGSPLFIDGPVGFRVLHFARTSPRNARFNAHHAENFVAGPPITYEELKNVISSKASESQSDSFIPWEKQHPELVEGDIMPSGSKNALIDPAKLWTNKIIPYVIDAAYTQDQRNIIATAMNEYHTKTCIRLVPRTTETNYIRIYKSGSGCWSYLGMLNRGMQELSLDDGCMVNGIVIHELMHAAGFWHEHMRPDRDTYVKINLANVLQQYRSQFDLLPTTQVTTLGLSYDYGSVMHYPKTAFAIDRNIDVITPLIGNPTLGQRTGFSDLDVQKLNKLYSCSGSCSAASG